VEKTLEIPPPEEAPGGILVIESSPPAVSPEPGSEEPPAPVIPDTE
jgi:hypothetical protein